jgi:hypothetical protein
VYFPAGVPAAPVVVTLTEELWADTPKESLAATAKLYCVPAVKPVTLYVALVVVAMAVPF